MSSVTAMPDRSSPRGRVAAEVRAELARASISGNRLAAILGQSQPYWSRRLSGKIAFDVDDLAAVAELLGVPMTKFFPAEAEHPRPGGPAGGAPWAPSDSNRQPTDYTSAQDDGRDANVIRGPWTRSGKQPTERSIA